MFPPSACPVGVGPLVGPTLVSGRLPSRPDEIALGASVLRSVGRQVGQDLTVGVNGAQRRMHIVGQAVFPEFDQGSFTSTDLGLGAAVTAADLVPPATPVSDSSVFVLVRFAPGPDQARQMRQLRERPRPLRIARGCNRPRASSRASRRSTWATTRGSKGCPRSSLSSWPLSAWGCSRNSWSSGSSASRREIAILKTIGFVRRQILSLVAWQAGTFAVLSLLIGIPLGIFVGRGAWALFAGELGIGSTSAGAGHPHRCCAFRRFCSSPCMVAVGPAWIASRVQPARALQTE